MEDSEKMEVNVSAKDTSDIDQAWDHMMKLADPPFELVPLKSSLKDGRPAFALVGDEVVLKLMALTMFKTLLDNERARLAAAEAKPAA